MALDKSHDSSAAIPVGPSQDADEHRKCPIFPSGETGLVLDLI